MRIIIKFIRFVIVIHHYDNHYQTCPLMQNFRGTGGNCLFSRQVSFKNCAGSWDHLSNLLLLALLLYLLQLLLPLL